MSFAIIFLDSDAKLYLFDYITCKYLSFFYNYFSRGFILLFKMLFSRKSVIQHILVFENYLQNESMIYFIMIFRQIYYVYSFKVSYICTKFIAMSDSKQVFVSFKTIFKV